MHEILMTIYVFVCTINLVLVAFKIYYFGSHKSLALSPLLPYRLTPPPPQKKKKVIPIFLQLKMRVYGFDSEFVGRHYLPSLQKEWNSGKPSFAKKCCWWFLVLS